VRVCKCSHGVYTISLTLFTLTCRNRDRRSYSTSLDSLAQNARLPLAEVTAGATRPLAQLGGRPLTARKICALLAFQLIGCFFITSVPQPPSPTMARLSPACGVPVSSTWRQPVYIAFAHNLYRIHQPSAELFQFFDRLLLLKKLLRSSCMYHASSPQIC
jgi:hypothetical protein